MCTVIIENNFYTYVTLGTDLMICYEHFKYRQTENVLVNECIGKCTKANYSEVKSSLKKLERL